MSVDARPPLAAAVDFRRATLVAVGVLTLSYASVLYHVTDVVGGRTLMLAVLAGAVGLALTVGRVLRPRTAAFLTLLFVAGGFAAYFLSVPESQRALLSTGRVASDTVALLTGLSVLRLTQADVWALAVAPAPVFLSGYLAVRRWYASSVVVGGVTLGLFVLTGDAGTVQTLVGVVAGAAAVGLGTLDRHGGSAVQLDTLAVVLVAMTLLAATLSVVPGAGAAEPLLPSDRPTPTAESTLVDASDHVTVQGTIRLSPKVRFTVQSGREEYWQTAAYDRYTGSGWVRSGQTDDYAGRLDDPPGADRRLDQTVTAETSLGSVPAAWKPVTVDGRLARTASVTPQGGIRPGTTVSAGESYTVTSRVPRYTTAQLRRAGTDYPEDVEAQYTRLPESTPDRVRQRADEVTADAETPYDEAVAIESYLEANKRYSLTVDRPEGNVADAFLFEMDAGYCTYYATTMVAMLRAEGVPARFVTGYTPGQRVAEDEWVVRGLDSHAWVQVYFPDVGWVRFDPTPAAPRQSAERARLADARQSDEPGVDTENSGGPAWTPTPTGASTPSPSDAADPAATSTVTANPDVGSEPEPDLGTTPAPTESPGTLPDLPTRETLALWAVALVGLVAGARRTGATDRAVRAVWLRRQRTTDDPDADAARAFARLSYLLERRTRPRRPGETPRAYVAAVAADDRARRVVAAYERAHYGDGLDRATADDAVAIVDELVAESTLPGRLFDR
ncbi:MAG: transglutaminase domain-containing protein [Haloplanus sp.]